MCLAYFIIPKSTINIFENYVLSFQGLLFFSVLLEVGIRRITNKYIHIRIL